MTCGVSCIGYYRATRTRNFVHDFRRELLRRLKSFQVKVTTDIERVKINVHTFNEFGLPEFST